MKELVSELLKFPLGGNDDLPDALSMQLNLWRMTKTLKQYRAMDTQDPLSYEVMVKELGARRKGRLTSSLIFDPSRALPQVLEFTGRN